jgi:hypothetical protein
MAPTGFLPFLAYGTPCDELLDPMARRITALTEQIETLRQRIETLEAGDNGPHQNTLPRERTPT